MQNITLILDSNEYIFGFRDKNSHSASLLTKIKFFKLKIPFIIIEEVDRNLPIDLQKKFYQLIGDHAEIVFKLPPEEYLEKYRAQRLKSADSLIAAYCEFLNVDFLISENRHFLVDFHPKSFKVFSAHDFLKSGLK